MTPPPLRPTSASRPARPLRRRILLAALVAGVALAAGRGAYQAWRGPAPAPAGAPALVAITPFAATGPALQLWREGMMDLLAHNVDGAGPLRVLSPAVVLRSWRAGGDERAAAAALARRTGAGTVVLGAIEPARGDSVRAVLTIHEAATGRRLGRVERREFAARIDRLSDSLTVDLIVVLDALVPVGAVRHVALRSARSLDALRPFLRAEQFYRRAQWDSARLHYEQAIQADSAFALAHRRLGTVLGFAGLVTDSAAEAHLLRAGALNRRLGPRDSLLVLADSLAAGSGAGHELEQWRLTRRRLATLDAAVRGYPGDPEVWYEVGEARYHAAAGPVIGASPRATLDAFDRAIAADPAFVPAYAHTAQLGLEVGGPALALDYLRRYHAVAPTAALGGRDLLTALLEPPGIASPDVRRLVDTTAPRAVSSARVTVRRWPDPAETAVQLARVIATGGRGSRHPLYRDSTFRERSLAEQLAYRGHVREAARVIGRRDALIAVELAYLGATPPDSTAARLARLLAAGSPLAAQALGWWAERGDSASLAAFAAGARARLRAAPEGRPERLVAAYDTAAALAYLALARRDTALALQRFAALPDTLCPRCHTHRFTRAQLLARRGNSRAALAALRETLVAYLSPFELLFALERARVAEQLGERAEAREGYRLVAAAWANGDPEVQPMVAAAHAGLRRLPAP